MSERKPRLVDKVAIVTGAGSSGPGVGTGKAISTLFAREGARVLLVDRVTSHAEETLALIRGEGGEASVFQADATKIDECARMAEAAYERYGGLHILVNNVGILGSRGTVEDLDPDNWDKVLEVNLKSMMLTSRYAVPKMVEGGGGSIINMSSMGALRGGGRVSSLSYNASKGGVISLTITMAIQNGRDNIRVNCIVPGDIDTPMASSAGLSEEQRETRRKGTPLGTVGTAWDVAWTAVFLASEEARWITGAVLSVDGGTSVATPLAMLPYLQ